MSFDKVGKKKWKKIIVATIVLLVLISVTTVALFLANRSRQERSRGDRDMDFSNSSSPENSIRSKTQFLKPSRIGEPFETPPQVSNLAVIDLDNDRLLDVIVCDTKNNTVSWIRQFPKGSYHETVVAKNIDAPAHVQIFDVDGDGDKDLVVAALGMLYPNNEKIGSVIILENDSQHQFKKHVIADKIARVSDVRAGDLDGDGDMDLAVAQFGYSDGETRWMENKGNWTYTSHSLQHLSGPINIIITDEDKDGDLDIISLVSQEWEEVYCFSNDGRGHFEAKLLWGSNNEDFGSSSIFLFDLDKDGDEDILYTNGDSFNYNPVAERPWHGVQWLENKGGLQYVFHRICHFVGAYSCRASDIDKDGDIDLFVVSAFNVWENLAAQSFIWLENDGHMQFEKHHLANRPTHLLTLELGDYNNDGLEDMVTGGMHLYPPNDRTGRVTLWMNNGELVEGKRSEP